MSPIFSTLFFAATATAQITTSIWMPSAFDYDVGYYGSVVNSANDRITLALQYDDETDLESIGVLDNTAETVTIGGSTWFESVTTSTDPFEDNMAMTLSLACAIGTQSRARVTCAYSMGGPLAFEQYCSDYSTYTSVYTETFTTTYPADEFGPETTYTYTETVDYRDYIPDFCTDGTTLPDSIAEETMTLGRSYTQSFQVVITAGQERLEATAAAVPSNTGATVTRSVNGTTLAPTGSSTNAPIEQISGTGAAPPMRTVAPALLGLGAAMAAFL